MLKYAFISEIKGVTPENYYGIYENEECFNLIIGSPNMQTTEELVKRLASEGYTIMNFCGAFNEEMLEKLRTCTDGKIKMANVKYFPEELEKLEKLPSLKEFGLIIEGADKLTEVCIKSDSCNIHAYFVKDMEMAKEAAKKLVEKGVCFIEMCGWFKEDMTRDMINAISSSVPVGSAGI